MSADDSIHFRYTFELASGPRRTFDVALDAATLCLLNVPGAEPPEWARLDFYQCPNCPLHRDERPFCPLAAHLVDLVQFFAGFASYDEVSVRLETAEREVAKRTSVQKGVSSLLGIYMVSSGCPLLRKLRPMVRFHLPFATMAETAYRAISMHLTAQYFRRRRSQQPDWDLRDLRAMYAEVQMVNRSFATRLQHIEQQDVNTNALVILDNFANYVALTLDGDMLDDMEALFVAYFDPEDA